MTDHSLTRLLQQAGAGDDQAAERLYRAVYEDLRRMAKDMMGPAAAGSTLQPTAVVHEAWLKLCPAGPESGDPSATRWNERGHFLAVASKAMRSVLVDHARARGTQRRGGHQYRIEWDEALALFEDRGMDVLRLDEALTRFAKLDPELARVVELRFFGGLTISEAAQTIGVSTATVDRGWRTARAWLRAELGTGEAGGGGLPLGS